MKRKKHTPTQIVEKLRRADVLLGQGQTVAQAVKALEVTEQTDYRWRREYGGTGRDEVKRMKKLEPAMARSILLVAVLSACGNAWLPSLPTSNTAPTADPAGSTAMWNAFVDDIEAADVVRVYYSRPIQGTSGSSYAMVTVHQDGRAAIDYQGSGRDLLADNVLEVVSGDGYGERLHGPIDATGWATAISLSLNHLSMVPTTLWGPDLPAHHQETFPDLGYAVQARLDIGGDDSLNLGFLKEGDLRRARFDNADGSKVEYQIKHVVFDPVLPSDFFQAGGTVHADGSDTLWWGPQ